MKTYEAIMYCLIAVVIGLVGYMDVVISFRPIGSFWISLLIGIVWMMRKIVANYSPRILISGRILGFSLICILLNFSIGIYLNSHVTQQAKEAIAAIEDFHFKNGRYPEVLLDAIPVEKQSAWSKSKLKFGANYYYAKTRQSFVFEFWMFPAGSKSWNAVSKQFEIEMD